MGDLNTRTGKYSDRVCKEGSNLITNDQSEFSLCPTQRNSFDNSHGKRLLEIFKISADLRILNGIVSGDSLRRVTFHDKNGVSVVDYAVCDQDLFSHVANFVVKDPLHLSDHSPITTEKERMFHQSRKKIGYNISTIFIQMNLLTQRSKTFAMSYDKMNAMVNTLVL